MTKRFQTAGPDGFEITIDRDAEVPIGLQLAWALRARIQNGAFRPGQRLPGLRQVADATGVSVNTVRAVYQRLDQEGLIDTQQGSGTFVTSPGRRPSHAASIAANAAQESRETGVDPREVAAALYAWRKSPTNPAERAAGRRRELRTQIAALERTIGELQTEHLLPAPPPTATRNAIGPALLGAEELEGVRTSLVRRLIDVQGALDEQARAETDSASPARTHRAADRSVAAKPKRARGRPRATRPAAAET
jgi:DNA-binding transcriptional regulator YhcF (GntR family)